MGRMHRTRENAVNPVCLTTFCGQEGRAWVLRKDSEKVQAQILPEGVKRQELHLHSTCVYTDLHWVYVHTCTGES